MHNKSLASSSGPLVCEGWGYILCPKQCYKDYVCWVIKSGNEICQSLLADCHFNWSITASRSIGIRRKMEPSGLDTCTWWSREVNMQPHPSPDCYLAYNTYMVGGPNTVIPVSWASPSVRESASPVHVLHYAVFNGTSSTCDYMLEGFRCYRVDG